MDPSSKRQRNYNLSVTRFFLSSSSSRLGVTLVIETLDSKEILIVPSFEEVKGRGGRATLFQGCSKLGELGEEQPHRLIRKEWKGSIPSSFFSLLLPSLFRSILTGRRCEFLYLGVANCRTRSSNDANKRVARERLRERREKMVNKEEGRISDRERRSKSRIIEVDVAREECGRSRT